MHTSFSEPIYDTRTINEVAKDEELRCAYAEIDTLKATIGKLEARGGMLEADLLECREFIEQFSDVDDGDGYPRANRAMRLVTMIDMSLHGPGNF